MSLSLHFLTILFPHVFVIVTGMWFGSYATMAVYRLPRGMAWIGRDTRCVTCDTPLSLIDFLPIFSYFITRGKCRHCGHAYELPGIYLLVELFATLFCWFAYVQFGFSESYVCVSAIALVTVVLIAIDLDGRPIPMALWWSLLVLALFWRIPLDYSIFPSLQAAGTAIVVLILLRHIFFHAQGKHEIARDYLRNIEKGRFSGPGFSLVAFAAVAAIAVGWDRLAEFGVLCVLYCASCWLGFRVESPTLRIPWFLPLGLAVVSMLLFPEWKYNF